MGPACLQHACACSVATVRRLWNLEPCLFERSRGRKSTETTLNMPLSCDLFVVFFARWRQHGALKGPPIFCLPAGLDWPGGPATRRIETDSKYACLLIFCRSPKLCKHILKYFIDILETLIALSRPYHYFLCPFPPSWPEFSPLVQFARAPPRPWAWARTLGRLAPAALPQRSGDS